jgi:phage terminase large subunit-like protein
MSDLTRKQKEELLKLAEEKTRRERENLIKKFFPDSGKFAREKYPKQLKFFEAGNQYTQRAIIAANQSGKSFSAAYEVALHLTGDYPEWWTGKRFDRPIEAWAAGWKSNVNTVIQRYLLEEGTGEVGSGMIPKNKIHRLVKKQGATGVYQDIFVKHSSGGISRITLKNYTEDAEAFQGARLDLIWIDEEPKNNKIYTECLTRLVAKQGILICTFTPLNGYSDVVLSFLEEGKFPVDQCVESRGKYVVNLTWDDAVHLTEEAKAEMLRSYPPNEHDSRSKGIPSIGSGLIYPLEEENFIVDPFEIPKYWERGFGFDPGHHVSHTAAVWGAKDPETGVLYIYSEYYRKGGEPIIHADAIKARGHYLTGAADYAGTRDDGRSIMNMYIEDFDLDLIGANKSVEAGIQEVWQGLSSGKIKIFKSLTELRREMRIYRRDENGRIVKRHDHLCDALRYFIMTGLDFMMSPLEYEDQQDFQDSPATGAQDGRDPTTGY